MEPGLSSLEPAVEPHRSPLTLGHRWVCGLPRPEPAGFQGCLSGGALLRGALLFQLRGVHSLLAAVASCVSVTVSFGPIPKGD